MADLDPELVERVARWCAEAGRHAGAAEIRAALGGLSWDALLHARALLADPPPARPLGPFALADLARGTPADVAAEREREGRYLSEETEAARDAGRAAGAAPAPEAPPAHKVTRTKKRGPAAQVVVRRAADRPQPPEASTPALPLLADLFEPPGRAVVERLMRRHGGRRPHLLAALAAGWRSPEGIADRELDALLDHHGLANAYAHRERDELLHALRAAGGSLAGAAERVGTTREGLVAAVARLDAGAEVERVRAERRDELRRRSTLTDRVAALLGDAARVEDLGLSAELEADLRARLPEHARALRAAGEPVADGLARTLALGPAQAAALAARFGLEAGGAAGGFARREAARPSGRPDRRPGRPERPGAPSGPRRPGTGRPATARTGGPAPRPGAGRPASGKPGPAPRRPAARGPGPGARGPGARGPAPRGPGARGPAPRGPGRPGPRPGGKRPPARRRG
ncbi:MAG: Fis family transcriptional regulator [Anaeromyxobacteraceae bacterium]